MTDTEYLALVEDAVRGVVDHPLVDIGPDTRIADLGIDSIAFAEVVVRLEEPLGIEVPLETWLRVRTVREALELIKRVHQP
jgi:acyl carrier protein